MEGTSEDIQSQSNTVEAKIIDQIEYFFGDTNLTYNRVLKKNLLRNDGWISLTDLVVFNGLETICADSNVIVEVLRKSLNNLIEVSGNGQKVRRSPLKPVPEEDPDLLDEIQERSVFVKGFPLNTTLWELRDFFGQYGGQFIYMKRKMLLKQQPFTGCVYVHFVTKEKAVEFISNPKIEYRGNELVYGLKLEYLKYIQKHFKNTKKRDQALEATGTNENAQKKQKTGDEMSDIEED